MRQGSRVKFSPETSSDFTSYSVIQSEWGRELRFYMKKIINFFEKNKKISFSFVLLTLIAMWYFSSLPGTSFGPRTFNWLPIAYHFLIFFAFAFFFLSFIIRKNIKIKYILITILVSLIVAVSDEIHQYFVPLRSSTIGDVLIDMSGVVLLVIIYFLIRKIRHRL